MIRGRPMRLRWPQRLLAVAVAGALLGGAGLGAAWWIPLPARLVQGDSTVVRWRDGQAMHVFLASDDRWRVAVAPQDVDPAYLSALKQFEDHRFDRHPGVDPLAIARRSRTSSTGGSSPVPPR